MKATTRDNLIYLAVGLSIAALFWAYFFYADSHGREMWLPSRFAIRTVYTTALIWYVVLRGIHTGKQTFIRVLVLALFATLLHLSIVFAFRSIIEKLPGIAFALLWVPEMYFIVVVTEKSAPYLTGTRP